MLDIEQRKGLGARAASLGQLSAALFLESINEGPCDWGLPAFLGRKAVDTLLLSPKSVLSTEIVQIPAHLS